MAKSEEMQACQPKFHDGLTTTLEDVARSQERAVLKPFGLIVAQMRPGQPFLKCFDALQMHGQGLSIQDVLSHVFPIWPWFLSACVLIRSRLYS